MIYKIILKTLSDTLIGSGKSSEQLLIAISYLTAIAYLISLQKELKDFSVMQLRI